LGKCLHLVYAVLPSVINPQHGNIDYCLRPFGECAAKLSN
jgi:hypothetical protein